MTLVDLLVFLLIVGLIFYAVRALSIPTPIVVVVVIVVVLYLMSALGLISGGQLLRLN